MRVFKVLCFTLVIISGLAFNARSVGASPYVPGDVFANVGGGVIAEFDPTLNTALNHIPVIRQVLHTAKFGTTTGYCEGDGMVFDSGGNLYATQGFCGSDNVTKFNNSGTVTIPNFGSGYNANPESIVIDNGTGSVYIGQPKGTTHVLKFDELGNPGTPAFFAPAIESRGTDWLDLESNGRVLRYTSEGNFVKRFDLATSTQLPDFNAGNPLLGHAFAHRILPDGGELVANTINLKRLNAAGGTVMTYSIPGTSLLFAMNLDPNGTSFWTADYISGKIFEVDIATGTILKEIDALLTPDTDPKHPNVLGGLAVFGEVCQTCPKVPEPSAGLLFGTALLGLIGLRMRHSV